MVGVNDHEPPAVVVGVPIGFVFVPSYIDTMEEASAVPLNVGLLLLVLVLFEGLITVGFKGAMVSTFHERLSGDPSLFPALSTALTWNV